METPVPAESEALQTAQTAEAAAHHDEVDLAVDEDVCRGPLPRGIQSRPNVRSRRPIATRGMETSCMCGVEYISTSWPRASCVRGGRI